MPILFVCGYVFFPYLMAHYCVVPAPGIILGVLLGKDVVERLTVRGGEGVTVFLSLGIAVICISRFPEIDRRIKDDVYSAPMMVYSHKYLPTLVDTPALVLFKYRPGASIYTEPVYNESVAWPDDAEIVRAQDLGPKRDREIVDYYARIQPERHVYILDRSNLDLRYYGTAGELARRFESSGSPALRATPKAKRH